MLKFLYNFININIQFCRKNIKNTNTNTKHKIVRIKLIRLKLLFCLKLIVYN